jgi:hypothetical protein
MSHFSLFSESHDPDTKDILQPEIMRELVAASTRRKSPGAGLSPEELHAQEQPWLLCLGPSESEFDAGYESMGHFHVFVVSRLSRLLAIQKQRLAINT